MMWFFRHFWIFISYHIFLLNQVEGAIAISPSNSVPLPLFCPSVCPSVCPSIGLLTTFSGFCTFADKSLGRNGIELEMQMFPDDLPLANIDADGYCCHFMLMYPDGLHSAFMDAYGYCCWSVCPSICPFVRLGLGQRRAVVIIGRWLLPSLVDTGDICCHYWQHILVDTFLLFLFLWRLCVDIGNSAGSYRELWYIFWSIHFLNIWHALNTYLIFYHFLYLKWLAVFVIYISSVLIQLLLHLSECQFWEYLDM